MEKLWAIHISRSMRLKKVRGKHTGPPNDDPGLIPATSRDMLHFISCVGSHVYLVLVWAKVMLNSLKRTLQISFWSNITRNYRHALETNIFQ